MEVDFGEIGKLSKSAQISALFQDFDAPLYNVWKRQVDVTIGTRG